MHLATSNNKLSGVLVILRLFKWNHFKKKSEKWCIKTRPGSSLTSPLRGVATCARAWPWASSAPASPTWPWGWAWAARRSASSGACWPWAAAWPPSPPAPCLRPASRSRGSSSSSSPPASRPAGCLCLSCRGWSPSPHFCWASRILSQTWMMDDLT